MAKYSDLFSISLDIFNIDVLVAINYSDKKLQKTFEPNMQKEEFDTLFEGFSKSTTSARWCVANGGWHVLRFKEIPSPGELAHECFHCVTWILRNIQVELNNTSEEIYAYLLAHLVEKITEVIKRKSNEARKKK